MQIQLKNDDVIIPRQLKAMGKSKPSSDMIYLFNSTNPDETKLQQTHDVTAAQFEVVFFIPVSFNGSSGNDTVRSILDLEVPHEAMASHASDDPFEGAEKVRSCPAISVLEPLEEALKIAPPRRPDKNLSLDDAPRDPRPQEAPRSGLGEAVVSASRGHKNRRGCSVEL